MGTGKGVAMQWARGSIAFTVIVLVAMTQGGCLLAAAGAAGAGTVAYMKGDLEADLDAAPDTVIEATRRAAEDLKFTTEYAHASRLDGRAKLRTAAGKEIFIKVESRGENFSHLSIRVGTFGDDSLSNHVLAKIRDNLKTASPQSSPAVDAE